jgi:hypothetical protein
MPKFLNKNELVLIALIILLFDVNGFCAISLPYIINGKGNLLLLLVMISFIIYSTYVYHSISHNYAPFSIEYKPDNDHSGIPPCNVELNEAIKEYEKHAKEMNKICAANPIDKGTYLAEKIVLTIIAIFLLLFVFVGVFKVGKHIETPTMNRVLRASPIVLLAICLLSFTHIYIPYFSKSSKIGSID